MSAPVGRTVIVPVVLGCCPDNPRCVLCPPPPPPPAPETVAALVDHYRRERSAPEDTLCVGFYGGAPPPDPLLDALDGLPFRIRVRPDLLSRSRAAALLGRGLEGVELDALTFHGGEASGHASPFSTADFDLSSRPTTGASVTDRSADRIAGSG